VVDAKTLDFSRQPSGAQPCPLHTRILILEANPLNLASLRTTTELKNLKNLLEPQGFAVEFGLATCAEEIQSLLRKQAPDILHFAGHGDSGGDLYAEDEAGNAAIIPMDALAEAVRIFNRETNGRLRLIVLNACYGARQAKQLARHVECVIAAHEPIPDDSAIAFATEFYGALAGGSSVVRAFDYGCNQGSFKGLLPVVGDLVLLTRPDVDAEQVIFAKRLSIEHQDYLRRWFDKPWANPNHIHVALYFLLPVRFAGQAARRPAGRVVEQLQRIWSGTDSFWR